MDTTLPSHVIEQFHLLFLAHLTRGADKRAIVLVDNAAVTERITRNRPRTIGFQVRVNF